MGRGEALVPISADQTAKDATETLATQLRENRRCVPPSFPISLDDDNSGKFLGFQEFSGHDVCEFQFLSHDYQVLTLQEIICDVCSTPRMLIKTSFVFFRSIGQRKRYPGSFLRINIKTQVLSNTETHP